MQIGIAPERKRRIFWRMSVTGIVKHDTVKLPRGVHLPGWRAWFGVGRSGLNGVGAVSNC